ncbi:hypothetical protein AVDCRST_MAG81-649 [uncultured Synechococcales cyanobacterium]|uniref:DUF306 domain-containing protein n=1 Tax=uncultured Synechococcales cyanobacterium TaxID=1936017 RepID=A0A6J4UVE8_9CYAN|nr:hypothetical protein AVDCRST_MAG81-649 [uncultured Synechococcales cyanobacterium]
MDTVSRLLVPLSTALLATALSLQGVQANLAEVSSPKILAQNPSSPSQSSSINVTGVIRFLNVEGGCYSLKTQDGRSYQLLGEFPRQDGLQVQVRGKLLPNTATICQVGQPLQVELVKALESEAQQRALEVSIFGIGPAVDQQAVEAVRSVVGRAVTVAACTQQPANPAQAGEQLADIEWALQDLGGNGVVNSPQSPTLRFTGTNRIEGQGGCNSYSAQSQVDGDRLTISALIATKRACIDQRAQEQESRYFSALEGAQRFSLEGSELLIYSKGLAKPLRFSRSSSSSKPVR